LTALCDRVFTGMVDRFNQMVRPGAFTAGEFMSEGSSIVVASPTDNFSRGIERSGPGDRKRFSRPVHLEFVQAERELSRSNTTTPTRRHPDRGLRVKQVELHNGLIRLTKKKPARREPCRSLSI